MSLMNRFSVAYNMEKANKKKDNNDQNTTSKQPFTNNDKNANEFLGEDVVKPLINFGYELHQIMMAFKIYKFVSVDEAIYILMKDTETKKYNHRYLPMESENNYERVNQNQNQCLLCYEEQSEHFNFDSDFDHQVLDVNMGKRGEENKDTTLNGTNNQLIRSTDGSGLIEKKLNSENNTEKKILKLLQVEIPQETLDLFEDPDVCTICYGESTAGTNRAQFSCGHKFCKTCVYNHLNININNGKVLMIKCLSGGCQRCFVEEEIKEYVTPETFYKYRKFKIVQMKINNPNKFYINCPYPDCDEIVDAESIEDDDPMMECNLEHQFCAKCKSLGWHKKGKCKDYDGSLLQQIQKNSDSQNYKQCPQCSVIIEKNEGCNQMKCLHCSFEFCWLCGKKYSVDHYALYNFTGCPGMKFNTPDTKRWWNNPCLKSLWFILSFFLGIFAVCFLIIFFCFFGCCYEFVNCYLNRKTKNEEDDEEDVESQQDHSNNNIQNDNGNNNAQNSHRSSQDPNDEKKDSKLIIGLLIFLGILCQPLYVIFYALYGLMECYRRFSFWFYYVDF